MIHIRALGTLVLIAIALTASAGQIIHTTNAVPNRYVVTLNPGASDSPTDDDATARAKTLARATVLGQNYGFTILDVPSSARNYIRVSMSSEVANALVSDPEVDLITEESTTSAPSNAPTSAWSLDRIDQHSSVLDGYYSWGFPSDATTSPVNPGGAGVTIYIIDSGIDSPPPNSTHYVRDELGSRLRAAIDATVLNDPNNPVPPNTDPASNPNDVYSDFHGTKTAITAAGRTYGVARGASLVSLKVFRNEFGAFGGDIIRALDYVVTQEDNALANTGQRFPAVVNISIASPITAPDTTDDYPVRDAIQRVTSRGVTVVIGAGNYGGDACVTNSWFADRTDRKHVPHLGIHGMPGVIIVGGSDHVDGRAIYTPTDSSNYGPCVDIYAPSVGIPMPSGVGSFEGTSAAAPHVAGAAALLARKWTPTGVFQTPLADVKNGILNNATTSSNAGASVPVGKVLYVAPPPPPTTTRTRASNPYILSVQGARTAPPGDTSTITVQTISGSFTYEWYVGQVGDDAGSAKLTSTTSWATVQPTVTTSYWVRVINGNTYDDAGPVLITVVTPNASALQLNSSRFCAGNSTTATVTLDAVSGPLGTPVSLSSSSGIVQLPPQVIVPAGQTSTTFTVSTAAGPFPATATITAAAQGSTAQATLTADPQPYVIRLSTSAINGGTAVSATLRLSGPAGPGGQYVSLQSSDTTSATVPANVFIPAGASFTGFTISTVAKSVTQSVNITATSCSVSKSVALTVTACAPASISAQPTATPSSVTLGQSTALAIGASGTNATIQWYAIDGTPAGSGSNIVVTPSATTFYYAIVANACAQVTSAYVTVTVCIPASVTAQPTATSTSIFTGQSTTLSVGTAGTSPSIQWYTTGGALAGSGSSITLSPTTTTSYYAVVANSCGNATSNNITVNVTPCTAPSIASQPRSSTINSGQSATLSVTAAGTAPFTYQWYLSNGTRLNGTSSVLTVTPTATTSYYVIVTDPCGTIRSNTVTITICQPPGITSDPANTTPTTIHSGQTITMTVVAAGTALQYQWYQQLPTDSIPQAVIGASSNVLTAAPTQTGTKYTVKVYNGCGSVTSKTLTITVTP